ncbi:MAG: response regulator [Deltaproteobacteria bacterium]|nr:response regulator [Deltaproteobacteria bacterium]MBI4794493.1 response regulator [Deltaproteobacteria bacterium]
MGRTNISEARTEQQKMESAPVCLCFTEEVAHSFLETLGNLSLDCVGVTDHTGIIRFTNPACTLIFGMEPREVIGRHFREFYADPKALDKMLAECRAKGRVENWPMMVRNRQGKAVPVEITLVRIYSPGKKVLGSVAVVQDKRRPEELVRRLQRQELTLMRLNRSLEQANLELDRANRLKSEFLANTSHELRTPLNAIMGYLRLVINGLCDTPEEEREFLQNALDSARSLLNLINDLLDSARIEAGQMEVQLGEVNVPQIFEAVRKLTELQADQKNLKLSFKPSQGDMAVRGDPGKFQQVLVNLVANAIKFTPQGEVQVKARALPAKGHVRFEVQDTGIGIAPGAQQDLFKKFVQGDGSTTRQYGGTGLGLAICKNLVEFMGGQIWLTSPGLGRGTKVHFTLPLVSRQPLHWRRAEDREKGFHITGPDNGPLVLVVEDEPKIVDVMAHILNKGGYRTAYAVTADDGLEGARRLQPALVTIDMGLPVRPRARLHSGLDLCQALRRDPDTDTIPVLLVTGHEAALSQGKGGLQELPPTLNKPFRARELLDTVAGRLKKEPFFKEGWG